MTERLSAPDRPYVPSLEVRPGGQGVSGPPLRASIGTPTTLADDWWVALLWVERPDGLVTFRELASVSGPPGDPPLFRLGPALAGGLSGMIREEGGRQMMRLRHGVPAADPARPWDSPLVVLAAFEWEPMRAATMTAEAIAEAVLGAFRRAVEGLRRP